MRPAKQYLAPVLASLVLAASGCGSSEPAETAAAGVSISEIAVYQGVKRTLVKDGKEVASDLPLVAQRPMLVRVFTQTDSAYDKQEVTARLTIGGREPFELKATLGAASEEGKLGSTLNFNLLGSQIVDPLELSVEIVQTRDAAVENDKARYPAEGLAKIAVAAKKNTLRVLVVPYEYKADGSNRLPDLSDGAVKAIKDRLMQLYPVSKVEVTVHAPVPWTQKIEPFGQGWREVLQNLLALRSAEKIAEETYLYGMFNPVRSLAEFCGFGGCILGLTAQSAAPGINLRQAVGVGYPEKAKDTAAHEIGHAHGRLHANCGPGLDPRSIDTNYPKGAAYSGGKIGVWGFDIVGAKLIKPTATDFMGYCDNQWISDYNYIALSKRAQQVNTARWQAPRSGYLRYDVVTVDGAGHATFGRAITRRRPLLSSETVEVVLDAGRTVAGEYFRFDHLPGGWLFVPKSSAMAADFVIDGRSLRAAR